MKYTPDRDGTAQFLLSNEAQDMCENAAKKIATTAKRLTREKSGRHKRSIRARPAVGFMGKKNDRRGYEVIADAPYSPYVEFGGTSEKGIYREGDHALRRAVEQSTGR